MQSRLFHFGLRRRDLESFDLNPYVRNPSFAYDILLSGHEYIRRYRLGTYVLKPAQGIHIYKSLLHMQDYILKSIKHLKHSMPISFQSKIKAPCIRGNVKDLSPGPSRRRIDRKALVPLPSCKVAGQIKLLYLLWRLSIILPSEIYDLDASITT